MIENAPLLNTSAVATVVPPLRPSSVASRQVLHVINGEHFAGAERVQQHLGNCLDEFGYSPSFACLKPGKFRECSGLLEEQVYDFEMSSKIDLGVIADISKHVIRESVDLLHAHTPRAAMVTSQVAYRTGVPWIYHVHSPTARDSTSNFTNKLNSWVEAYSLRSCEMLMTVSRSLRREMLKQGWERQKLAVIPNGVPALNPINAAARSGRDDWKLGLIALMRPRKGVEVALDAMGILKDKSTNATLELIGGFETAEYAEQMMELEHKLQLGEVVQRTGFTSDIPSKIRELDALLLPSLFGEGMPMVVLEAISAGVPVIATSVEGTPEIIRHEREGLLAEPGDAQSLAEQILRLMADRGFWMELSQNALSRHREQFSDRAMASKVAKAYDRILDHRAL